MSKFYNNDYAKNKRSNNIVYQFVNEIVEISLEEYLLMNPNNNEDDFIKIKELSDNIFRMEDRADTNFNRKKLSIHSLNEEQFVKEEHILDNFIEEEEIVTALKLGNKFLKSGVMTEVQRRRFILHIIKGYSIKKIADIEGVRYNAVWDSVEAAYKKLKKFYKLYW